MTKLTLLNLFGILLIIANLTVSGYFLYHGNYPWAVFSFACALPLAMTLPVRNNWS